MKADLGFFVQDRWTVNRLAINRGLRFDYFNGYVPAQHIPATPSGWIPERDFAAVNKCRSGTTSIRASARPTTCSATGRTALKASIGRYVGQMNTNAAAANNPITTSVSSVTRRGGPERQLRPRLRPG